MLTRHINAPDEAASAAQRAVDLARPAGRFVAWAVVALLLAAALAWAGYVTACSGHIDGRRGRGAAPITNTMARGARARGSVANTMAARPGRGGPSPTQWPADPSAGIRWRGL